MGGGDGLVNGLIGVVVGTNIGEVGDISVGS